MKTFETEKGNIPEGATHYRDECKEYEFSWVKFSIGSMYIWCETYWDETVDYFFEYSVKPIPQTNIETPEEKEALDTMTGISREHLMNMINQQSEIIRELSEKLNTSESPNSSAWDGEGLPPVGVECWFNFKSRTPEKCTVKYIGDKICVYDDESGEEYSILLSSVEFSRLETEAEQIERERLENGQSLYELVQSLWCTVDSKYTPHPYSSPMVDDKTKEMYARLARAVDYRKESE